MKNSFVKKLTIFVGISVSIITLTYSPIDSFQKSGSQSQKEATIRSDSTSNYSAYQLYVFGVPGWRYFNDVKLR